MNRRKMLTLSAGLVLGGLTATNVKAREPENNLWYIHEDEFKTSIVLPKNKKRIVTNRFDKDLSQYEKIIKKAEALYPYYTVNTEKESGKPLWYSENRAHITPYNITSRAVNFYFDLTVGNKESRAAYKVEINQLLSVTQEKRDKLEPPEEVYEVSLSLNYGLVCGFLCGSGFDGLKRVVFNQKEEIIALYMPNISEWTA